jgi:hypothetical protein
MKSSHKLKRHRPRRTLPVSYLQVTSQLSHNTTCRAASATTQPAEPTSHQARGRPLHRRQLSAMPVRKIIAAWAEERATYG